MMARATAGGAQTNAPKSCKRFEESCDRREITERDSNSPNALPPRLTSFRKESTGTKRVVHGELHKTESQAVTCVFSFNLIFCWPWSAFTFR